jgi:hypothetical protein
MDFLALLYIAIMLLGVVWVVYRVLHYVRAQKEREQSLSTVMLSEHEFKAYLENLRQDEAAKGEETSRQDTEFPRAPS